MSNSSLETINPVSRRVLIAVALIAVAIVVLSLLPGAYRLRLRGVPDSLEHMVAYSVFGALVALALRGRVSTPVVVVGLLVFGGVIEWPQSFSPDRTASFRDYVFSSIGALGGVLVVAAARFLRRLSSR